MRMRHGFIVLLILALTCSAAPAAAQVSINIGLPSVNIGINIPVFPESSLCRSTPVDDAPRMGINYFFYDGMYWVYQGDSWYASYWYNGPWTIVAPAVVPVYILRVPVRYYRHPPAYFRAWRARMPRRAGGSTGGVNGSSVEADGTGGAAVLLRHPPRCPGPPAAVCWERYPRGDQQQTLHRQNYQYQPHDSVARQHYQQQGLQGSPAPPQRGQQQGEPQQRETPR